MATSDLVAVAAVGGTAVVLLLLRALPPQRFGRGALGAAGASLPLASFGGLTAESGWIPAAVSVCAAALLVRGSAARVLALASIAAFALSARAAHELTAAAWGPSRAAWALVLTSAAVLALAWPQIRERLAVQQDMALLLVLVGLAALAGPEAAAVWRRAVIAAEGQDPQAASPTPLWPVALCASAFVTSFVWRSLLRAAHLRKGTLR